MDIAKKLIQTLSSRVSAMALGLDDIKSMSKYADGSLQPTPELMLKMKKLAIISDVATQALRPEMVQLWMNEHNTLLGDVPVKLLRKDFDKYIESVLGVLQRSARK